MIALCCFGASVVGAAPTKSKAWLQQRLDALRSDVRLGGAKIGILVTPASPRAKALYAHEADRLSPLASNVKLLTSAAVLSQLGPDFRFKTAVYAPKRKGASVEGDLFLKGFGDPSLTAARLWRLADDLYEQGVREVRGALRIDEGYLDAQKLPPRYETRRTDAYYRPAVGALSINENVVRVRVRAAELEGDPALVTVWPRSRYLVVDNQVLTVRKGRRSYLGISTKAKGAKTVVVVRGRLRRGYRSATWYKRIADPGLFAGSTFLDLLARRGIKVRDTRVRRGKVPARLRALVVHRSRPLGEILRYMNKVSSNFMAEQLLKVLGAEAKGTPGTSAKGLSAVGQYLAKAGVAPGSYVLKNGSGLYDASSVSPRQIVRVLRAAYYDFKIGPDYMASLAISGVDGTLAHRFIGSGAERYIRAKTGTLAKVVAMSGYAGAQGRPRPLLFSILVSELPKGHIRQARQVVDEMAATLVTYLER